MDQNGHIPPHRLRVSVFGGLGAELFALPVGPTEIHNDRNLDVHNFMRCLRDHPDEMIRRAKYTAYHQAAFEAAHDLLRHGLGTQLDRAHAFGVVANQCHAGRCPGSVDRGSFGLTTKSAGNAAGWARIDETYGEVARRLRRVQCITRDWSWVLDRFDSPGAFVMLDPPYLGRHLYARNLTLEDHVRLLHRVVKLTARAMIFHTPHELYAKRLRRWRRIDVNFTSALGTTKIGNTKPRHTECVWINY